MVIFHSYVSLPEGNQQFRGLNEGPEVQTVAVGSLSTGASDRPPFERHAELVLPPEKDAERCFYRR